MKTFVIPDIHGRYDLVKLAVDHIYNTNPTGKIVFLGDYIDRGPESMEVVEFLFKGPVEGWEWVTLKGNHEEMLLMAHQDLNNSNVVSGWLINGGETTLNSYPDGEVYPEHVDWIKSLPIIHWDKHRIYVHAAVTKHRPLDKQDSEVTLWKRWGYNDNYLVHGRHIVHGHTPHREPELLKNRTNLDCGAVYGHVLVVGVFDGPGGPKSLIKVRNNPLWGHEKKKVWEEQL